MKGFPHITTDGNHGLIAVWADCSSSITKCDIFAQKVDASEHIMWQSNGVPIIAAPEDQFGPRIVSDNAGGAIVAWTDSRSQSGEFIYAQRVDRNGNMLWDIEGIIISYGTGDQTLLNLTPDKSGGAFIIWQESQEAFTDIDLFAQHINNQGTLLWSEPITITAAPNEQYYGDSAPDNAGGFLITWSDLRDYDNPNIYAQRVTASGAVVWAKDGALVSADPALQRPGHIVSDVKGGAFIVWYDFRSNPNRADVYMQRISATGKPAWEVDLPIVANLNDAEGPNDLLQDGAGGAILVANRYMGDSGITEADILAQRVDKDGRLLWGPEPLNITPWEAQQDFAVAVSDTEGGAFVAWIDKYTDESAYDVWTQHISAQGMRLWPTHGIQAVGAPENQGNLEIISDFDNGFIVAWQDFRNGREEAGLYAQRIGDADLNHINFLLRLQKP